MVKALALCSAWLLCLITAVAGLVVLPFYAWRDPAQAMRVAIGYDQTANAVLRGQPDEMLSAKAYRMRQRRQWPMRLIDWLFFKVTGQREHCRQAYEHEQRSAQLPEGYRG